MVAFRAEFEDLLNTGEDSDVTVYVDGGSFQLHSLILRTRSPFFKAQLSAGRDWRETSSGVVRLRETSCRAFELLLPFIYFGKFNWTVKTAGDASLSHPTEVQSLQEYIDMVELADRLQLTGFDTTLQQDD